MGAGEYLVPSSTTCALPCSCCSPENLKIFGLSGEEKKQCELKDLKTDLMYSLFPRRKKILKNKQSKKHSREPNYFS